MLALTQLLTEPFPQRVRDEFLYLKPALGTVHPEATTQRFWNARREDRRRPFQPAHDLPREVGQCHRAAPRIRTARMTMSAAR